MWHLLANLTSMEYTTEDIRAFARNAVTTGEVARALPIKGYVKEVEMYASSRAKKSVQEPLFIQEFNKKGFACPTIHVNNSYPSSEFRKFLISPYVIQ